MRINNAGLPSLLVTALLLVSANSRAQDINKLNVHSKLDISPLLNEISGMCFDNNDIYALNDGGNGSYIFKLDIKTGEIKEKFRIYNIRNKDWEELSIYGGYLYIGDFGNNAGTRSDLVIHRINIDSLNERQPPVLTTGMEYLMQKEYGTARQNNEWDCEAMVVNRDGILCFSKNRKDLITRMYKVKLSENNVLSPVDSLYTGFLVTGAYYQSSVKSLYLCGYYKNDTYLLHFKNADNEGFSDDCVKYIIPELKHTQVESVFVRGNYIYLASERTLKNQAIYRILVSGLK